MGAAYALELRAVTVDGLVEVVPYVEQPPVVRVTAARQRQQLILRIADGPEGNTLPGFPGKTTVGVREERAPNVRNFPRPTLGLG